MVKPTTSEHKPRWKHRFLRSQSSCAASRGFEEGSDRERGMGAVRKDEPLGKSSSLAAVVVSAAVLAGLMLAGGHM